MAKSQPQRKAERFIEQIKGMFKGRDKIIYEMNTSVTKPNVLSPSTVGNKSVFIKVTFYNVSTVEDIFSPHHWMNLGELGAEVNIYRDACYPSIEFYKTIEG